MKSDTKYFHWEMLAACRGTVTSVEDDFFFDAYEIDPVISRQVDEICLSCPVQDVCFEEGVSTKSEGVWGGVYLTSSGKVDKVRNAHKTQDVWRRIEDGIGRKVRP